jgi:hypothetical protein
MRKIDWIDSWKSGNKKKTFRISLRLGLVDIFYLSLRICNKTKKLQMRFMLLNYGFQI